MFPSYTVLFLHSLFLLLLFPLFFLFLFPCTVSHLHLDFSFCVHLYLHVFCGPVEDCGCGSVPSYVRALLRPLAGFWLVCGQTCLPLHQCPSLQDQQPLQVRPNLSVGLLIAKKSRVNSCYWLNKKGYIHQLTFPFHYLKNTAEHAAPISCSQFLWLGGIAMMMRQKQQTGFWHSVVLVVVLEIYIPECCN